MLTYINWLNSHGYSLSCLSVLWCYKLYISHRRGFSSLENIAKLNPILHDKIEYEMGLRITPYSTKIQKYLEKSIFYQHKTNYCMGTRLLLGNISNLARLVVHGEQKTNQQGPMTGGGTRPVGIWFYIIKIKLFLLIIMYPMQLCGVGIHINYTIYLSFFKSDH